jgi:phosphoribosylformylglycinamidine (FGAM) synthase-like enzyme
MGGFAVALAEMCMGGDLGATVDLAAWGDLPVDVKLFSESNHRWILEARGDPRALEAHLKARKVPFQRLGVVGGRSIEVKDGPLGGASSRDAAAGSGSRRVLHVRIEDARREFTESMHRRMG